MDIQGLATVMTGGASGLGLATAKKLAAEGAHVTLFDLNEELNGEVIRLDGAIRMAPR